MNFDQHKSPDIDEFAQEVRAALRPFADPDQRLLDDKRGDHHNPDLHRLLGERGWIMSWWPHERGGAGLTRAQAQALELELSRLDLPRINLSTTRMVLPVIDEYASEPLRSRVLEEVTTGRAVLTLGYTESESGSDIASARTRAVRDGDHWLIDGQKMYTTGAHNDGYVFLLARTDPAASKHAGLTMFLVPLTTPGIDVQPIHTLGERTNTVFFTNVRVPDANRLGSPGEGWQVLLGPLNEEHGVGDERALTDVGMHNTRHLATAFTAAADWATTPQQTSGHVPVDDPEVAEALAEMVIDMAVAGSVWGMAGRVAAAEAYQKWVGNLVDLIGIESVVTGHAGDQNPSGVVEHLRRLSQVASIYGGTVEVARSVIAQELGLPRMKFPA